MLVTSVGAGASHDLINWLVGQDNVADFSVGFDVDAHMRAAIITLRKQSWVPALNNTTGAPHEDADVADITALMRSGRAVRLAEGSDVHRAAHQAPRDWPGPPTCAVRRPHPLQPADTYVSHYIGQLRLADHIGH